MIRCGELLQNGVGNRSEIAYAAIVSGYYDDPVILDCVRELLVTDSDLRDLTGALLPVGVEPTEAQLRSVAAALRNVVLRHARYRCSVCGIDSSTFLWQCPAASPGTRCAPLRHSSSCRGPRARARLRPEPNLHERDRFATSIRPGAPLAFD